MELYRYDETRVRIVTRDGEIFEGECVYDGPEYCLNDFGREEAALEIDHWLFFASDIAEVVAIPEKPVYLWMSKPVHRMRLAPEPFAMIERGEKTIELRLYDEKRMAIKAGDMIRFESTSDEDEILYMRVVSLHVFDTFADLYRALPLTECGYTAESAKTASPADMNLYYSEAEQARYSAVGIRMEQL